LVQREKQQELGTRDGKEVMELCRSTTAPSYIESGVSPPQAALVEGQWVTGGSSSCAHSSAGTLVPGEWDG